MTCRKRIVLVVCCIKFLRGCTFAERSITEHAMNYEPSSLKLFTRRHDIYKSLAEGDA